MKHENKRIYSAPQLTVVTFKAERGYADSPQGYSSARTVSILATASMASSGVSNQLLDDRGSASEWTWQ